MHTFSESQAGVPAFVAKLWRLVEDPDTNQLIYWSKDGRSFIIQNQAQFAREILPLNYKHNNMASFIRQLNMYGFHKIASLDNGLKFDRDEMEFSHPCFKRGYPYLLDHIKRKIPTQKTSIDERSGLKTEAVGKVLNEVKVMRGRQDSLDSRFSVMKQENEALWREIASLRQKHMKQQQIVNKLIQFLVTMVQPTRNMTGVKRHFQLMINDSPQEAKVRKVSEGDSGPVIHELTEELLEEVAESGEDLLMSGSPNVLSPEDVSNNQIDPDFSNDLSPNPDECQNFIDGDDNVLMPGSFSPQNDCNIVYHISEVPESVNIHLNPQFFNEITETSAMEKQPRENLGLKSKKKDNKSRVKVKVEKNSETTNPTLRKLPAVVRGIKTENKTSPLLFADAPSTSEQNTSNAEFASPNVPNTKGQTNSKQMYTSGDFISTDIPTDLFEYTTADEDPNLATSSGKSGVDAVDKLNDVNAENKDGNMLILSKYKQKLPNNDDIMRMNTPDEFNTHLDNVQDDLDNLKDILRGDGCSLDPNTLFGSSTSPNRIVLSPMDGDILTKLFCDSDILPPYGLSASNDHGQDESKKGSELIAYQPGYTVDLSDIFNINDSEDPYSTSENANIKSPAPSASVLNTPCRERD